MRVPLLKAFHMAFRIVSKKKGMSSVELANEVGVQQKTAWLFKRKMQAIMQLYDKEKLRGAKNRRNNIQIVRSKGSDFFEEMHKQIMILKMWLTGIHHKCSKQHLKAYTAEY